MGRFVKHSLSGKIHSYKVLIIVCITIITLFPLSCNSVEPTNGLQIKLEDVSCTEAWINVTGETGSEIVLNRDDKEVQRFTITTSPQTIYDDSLLPNKTYTYQVYLQNSQTYGNRNPRFSNKLSVATLDTTSHDFTWQTWSFGGEAGSSTLFDVAIINENDIWAVGEIYTNDSLGNPDPNIYNAVHWDGKNWEIKRIYYYGTCSAVQYPPLKAIYTFSENSIAISNGGSIGWFNGNTVTLDCRVNPLLTGAIKKIWGTSSSNLYIVGDGGSIAHYNGTSWQKIESGTSLNINDIWGDYNERTKEYEIIAIASNIFENSGKEVLKIKGLSTEKLNPDGLSIYYSGLWFKSEIKYYIVGGGIHWKQNLADDKNWQRYESGIVTNYYSYAIRGIDLNDIVVAGSFGEIVHFNGLTWRNYLDHTGTIDGNYYSISIENNMIVVAGYNSPGAIITVGRR